MRAIKKIIDHKSRKDIFTIIPLGDIHLGAATCDEKRLIDTVKNIKDNDFYWVGMGDYCNFINRRDPRYSLSETAEWLWGEADMAAAQKKRLIKILKPIASQCLALVEGNHESAILRHTERDIYSEIVTEIKEAGRIAPDVELGVGYYGWLQLFFRRKSKEMKLPSSIIININLHHGFVGGKLAGAKALNMQRWLWNHNADITIFGHSHNTSIQSEAVEYIDNRGNVKTMTRKGCFAGTFQGTIGKNHSTYAEVKGYFPLPMDGVEIMLRPGAKQWNDVIRILL